MILPIKLRIPALGNAEIVGEVEIPDDAFRAGAKLAYTVAEAAEQLGVSPETVRREIDEGKIRAARIRGRVAIPHAALEEALARTA